MKIQADLFSGVLPFVRTAEEKSFVKAAASLGVTTAAVSKAVRKLEGELGVRLLERSSRVVRLTREGEAFLPRCQQAVLSIRGAREALQDARREPQGEVSMTLPFILAPFVVPNLVRLSALHPRLSYRLEMSDRVARLGVENYDVAIRLGELEDSTLVSRLLRRTRWVTVASPAYLAAHPEPKRPEDLTLHNGLRFVGPGGKPVAWSFSEGGRARSFTAKGNLLIDHGDHLLSAARSGLGICQILDFMVEEDLRDGTLVKLLDAFSSRGPAVHALTTEARATSTNVRALFRFLIDVFGSRR